MSKMGLVGARLGKEPVTTTPLGDSDTPSDLLNRHFGVDAPDRLWLADLSRVRTGCGWVYLGFVIDAYSRRVLRWRHHALCIPNWPSTRQTMAIASRRRDGRRTDRAVHHSDHRSQYLSIRYSQRLNDNNIIVASVGSVGDSYDNAMT